MTGHGPPCGYLNAATPESPGAAIDCEGRVVPATAPNRNKRSCPDRPLIRPNFPLCYKERVRGIERVRRIA